MKQTPKIGIKTGNSSPQGVSGIHSIASHFSSSSFSSFSLPYLYLLPLFYWLFASL